MSRRYAIVVLGLSLSSSWGNGHATTYRALVRALALRGHKVLFLERSVPWYAQNRDLTSPAYCRLAFYDGVPELRRFGDAIAGADLVVVGSYVPQGIEVGNWVLAAAQGIRAFYDIDTPVTLGALKEGTCGYLAAEQVRRYDLYLSFTGGPTLARLESKYGARAPRALYCSVDRDVYKPRPMPRRWHLGYLGTYSADRQPMLEELLIEPARRRPDLRFVVAGAQYPDSISWPHNVELIPHLPPAAHPGFYSSLGWALNVTRQDMVRAGYSPSVRLFEAAACGCPLVSDPWRGLDCFLETEREIAVAASAEQVIEVLEWPERRRLAMARAARERVLRHHTSLHRARELEGYVAAERERTAVPAE